MSSGKVTPGVATTDAHVVWIGATDGTTTVDGETRYLRERARTALEADPRDQIGTVSHFDDEYGFAFKRLPVARFEDARGRAAFVDPADGAIAAVVDGSDRFEGWVFAYVHKFEWMTSWAGEDWRDGTAAALTLLLASAALLGIAMALLRRRVPADTYHARATRTSP
jgi:hypothetical protein